jgi:peptidoglycan/LPS O-acetylase OafA/YrhL
VTAFWYVILALGFIAAIVNFAIAGTRRKEPVIAIVRAVAGLISLGAVAGIIIGKALSLPHPYLQAQYVFIAFGVFIFAVLVLPSWADRSRSSEPRVTMQQRAARPANATIRLRDAGKPTDEWVN